MEIDKKIILKLLKTLEELKNSIKDIPTDASFENESLTIRSIKKLASERNYSPNKIALSLKNNRTLTIGVVIPDILNRFYATVLNAIHESADRNGDDIIIFTTK